MQKRPCGPHLAGRTLRAALQKASPLRRRPQDKPILSRAFYNRLFLGRRPKPALLFLIAEKEGKKASPLGTYKTYFEPGVLQLPTVGQIKRLYNSVQNRFYKQVQKGAFNGKRQKQTATTKDNNTEENDTLFYVVRASTRVSVGSMIFQI